MTRLVIAEDDADIRGTLRLILEESGYTDIIETTNGRETLTLLHEASESYIVLLDLFMPNNGKSVVEALAQDPTLSQRHVLVLITAAQQSQLPAVVKSLSARVIFKPFDIDRLLETIRDLAEQLP